MPSRREVAGQLLLAAAIAMLDWLSARWFAAGGIASVVWPASGVALAAVLLAGPRCAWAVFLGAAVGGLLAGHSPVMTLGGAAANALGACAAGVLALRGMPGVQELAALRHYVALLLAGGLAAGISALGGAVALVADGRVPPHDFFYPLIAWWQGDFLGVLLLTPLLLLFAQRGLRFWRLAPPQLLLLAVAFVVGQVIYAGWFPRLFGVYARDYWSFLLIALSALTMGRFVTATLVAMTALQVLAGIVAGVQAFAPLTGQDALVAGWMFLGALSITGTAAAIVVHERRLARRSLEGAGRQRQRILEALAEGLVLQNADGSILECNPAAERILGVRAEGIAGSLALDPRWRAIREDGSEYPRDEHPALLALHNRSPVRDAIMGVHRPDGTLVWLSINAEPLLGVRGQVDGVVSTFFDITRLKTSMETLTANTQLLARQEEFLAVIAENVPAMVAYWTRGLRCTYANARYREWFGLPDRPFVDIDIHSLLGEQIVRERRAHVDAVLRGEPQSFESRLQSRSGSVIDVIVQYFPDRSGDTVRGFITLVHDVSSIKHAAADRLRLASIVEAADDAIFSTGLDGTVLAWNAGAERMLGCRAADAVGFPVAELLPGDGQPVADILATVARREHVRVQKQVWRRGVSAPVAASFAVSPILDETGKVLGVSWIVRDISVRVQIEQRLIAVNVELDRRVEERTQELMAAIRVAEEAVAVRNRFVANVSHEIRTPLNAILGMSHLALSSAQDPRQRDYLQKISIAGDHLLSLIENLLDFSRIDSGKLVLEETGFHLDAVIDTVSGVVVPALEAAGRRLVVDIAPDVERSLRGDPLRLRQMLINYVNNAIKFSTAGEVTIRVRRLAGDARSVRLQFDVTDTGIGIPVGQRESIFRPFQQADPSTSRRFGGTGLGLAITAQIAALMGGEVGVDSEEGVGSRFWFNVRLGVAAGLAALPPRTEPESGNGLQGLHVLLVEDSLFNQQVCSEMLAMAGARATVVESGQRALEMLRDGATFDVVLMDIQMPGMDGVETTQMLRAEGLLSRAPVLALTANASVEDRRRCLAAGMVDVLTKPVRPADLQARILAAVGGRQPAAPEMPAASPLPVDPVAPVIDDALLHAYIGERPEAVERYVGLFLDMAGERLQTARAAAAAGDAATLRAIGHQLKSSAGQIGATGFAIACRLLELRSAHMTPEETLQLLEQLQADLVRIGEWLARRVAGDPVP